MPSESKIIVEAVPVFRQKCPAQAKVLFVQPITDEASASPPVPMSEADFPPVPSRPKVVDLTKPPFVFPLPVLADVEVSPEGKVTDLALRDERSPEFKQWLKVQTASWVFLPALKKGVPVDSNITLLFRFVRNRAEFLSGWTHLLPKEDGLYGVVDVVRIRSKNVSRGTVSFGDDDLTLNDPEFRAATRSAPAKKKLPRKHLVAAAVSFRPSSRLASGTIRETDST